MKPYTPAALAATSARALREANESAAFRRTVQEVRLALQEAFPRWLAARYDLPTTYRLNVSPEDSPVDRWEVRETCKSAHWLLESLRVDAGLSWALDLLLAPDIVAARAQYFATLAELYADNEAAGLALAGWTAEDVEGWQGGKAATQAASGDEL